MSQVCFSFKVLITLQCHEGQLFCTFYLKLYIIFTTGAHQSEKFQTFGCSGKISLILFFDRLLLLKVCKIAAKKVQRGEVMSQDTEFEEKPICCFKYNKNLVNFDLSTQVSKLCTVIYPLCAKYIAFNQKKVQRSYL